MKTLAFLLLAAVSLDPSQVAPDIAQRLARFQKVEMPFTYAGMSAREKRVVDEMIAACRDLEDIFWRQNDPENVALYNSLAGATDPKLLAARHYLWINGSRFDLLNHNEPFIGSEPMPPGRSLLPKGVSRDEIEAYVKAHPAEKTAIYAERTVVELVSRNPLKLTTTPYHVKYRRWLEPAAEHLRNAAAASDDKAFANYLRMRAKALLTDDYYPSDLAWVRLKDPKFDLIFAPYETYLDDLLGVKTSYGASVLVRNETESAKLAVFKKYVPDIQDSLPLAAEDRPSK
ncbi:MAG TPA: Zn-dependent hydrolase, partial [Thermoanaerobaculia bacterium]